VKDSTENLHIRIDDEKHMNGNLHFNQPHPNRHSDQLLHYPNPMASQEQRALQEVPISSLNDMHNRYSNNNQISLNQ